MRITLAGVGILLLMAGVTSSAAAQRRDRAAYVGMPGPSFGVHFGYNFDIDEPLIGAQATVPLARFVAFYPSFDYYFTSGFTEWGVNGDLKLFPGPYHAFYGGTGLNYTHVSVNGSGGGTTNLNLFAGLQGHRRFGAPFLEGRLIVGNGSMFQLVAGFSWR